MKKYIISLSILLFGVTSIAVAITWPAPKFNTTDNPQEGTTYYLYHVGRKQMLTYGGKWETHAILDSTGVNALPYLISSTGYGYTFYSDKAGSQGLLFRESTGTGVYTDYNNHGDASTHWAIVQNGDGTVHIMTDRNDYVWGTYGYKITSNEYDYLLGWDPSAEDRATNGAGMGTNQSVYMLKPENSSYETSWAFLPTADYERYQAQKTLYMVAVEAERNGIDYSAFTAIYNGNDVSAMVEAAGQLREMLEQGEEPAVKDTIFFMLDDSTSMIFPRNYIEQWDENADRITLSLKGDTSVVIMKSRILSQDSVYHGKFADFESFKFNNKFNDQLYTDAIGEIDTVLNSVNVSIACIGKRLTPSFQLPDGVNAYVGGVRQHSKETRLRFDKPVHYTLAYPKQYLYQYTKIKDEIWSNPETQDNQWLSTKVELTGDMFSTNAPSNNGEDPSNMLDGNHNTIYHSTWGSGQYTPLTWYDGATYGDGGSEWPYLQIDLPEALNMLKFEYTTRNSGAYALLGFIIQVSADGENWSDVQTFTSEKDNLPTTADATYYSPVVNLGGSYSHLRLQLTASQRKNYLVMSEFSLYSVTENPDFKPEEPQLLAPAEYKRGFVPFGTDYVVNVDFLTEHSTTEYNVPRIDITFGDGQSWNSSVWIGRNGKKYYEDATISIDGGGVFPDLEETSVLVRGRGNSSWTNSSSSKNPYRLKFEEKQKPLGMKKGKSWVLLANKQSGSMTTNALAMKIADMVQSDGCNHIIPVELYVNGHYRGSYNFTEKTGFSNNSIDLDDETYATMLELDSYYDEPYKFRDDNYNLYVNVKEPDLDDATVLTMLDFNQIRNAFNAFTYDVKNYIDIAKMDVESVCRAMLVNDLARNEECKHPKSWFIYNANISTDSLWHLGPVWDFDWAFGYEGTGTYFINNAEIDLFEKMSSSNIGYPFFLKLLRGSEKVKKAYYRLWTEFIESGKLDELIEYCDDYYQYVQTSLQHNYSEWNDGNQYATITTNSKNWLTKRANHIYKNLEKYDLSPDIDDPDDDYGQPDRVDLAEVMGQLVDVYTINGVRVRHQVPIARFNQGLMPGIYIVNGRKIAVGR